MAISVIQPPQLVAGDEIRVIAPSDSLKRVGGIEGNQVAVQKLKSMGFSVSYGQYVEEANWLNIASIEHRVADLHASVKDPHVKAIMASIGGFNANELLPYLDFDLIRAQPKIFCGFSDFTALANAITAKTGLVTYYGPAFATLKLSDQLGAYQDRHWLDMVTKKQPLDLTASKQWSSDEWFLPNAPRHYFDNQWAVYTPGKVTAQTVGGNLNTLYVLQGTPYQPNYEGKIILIEYSDDRSVHDFSRNLAALLQSVQRPAGLLIGRFAVQTGLSKAQLCAILDKFPILKAIPVLYNVNFGHTQPILTLPIGDTITLETKTRTIRVVN